MATFSQIGQTGFSDAEIEVLTSSSDSTIILSILCANTSVAATDVTVKHKDGSSVLKNYIVEAVAIPSDSSLELLSNKYILPSGETFSIQTSVSGSLSYSISYVEV